MKVYFDNAATTPIAPEVAEAMIPILKNRFGNPSSIHSFGRDTRALIENARKNIAKLLHAAPSEIFFTSGGTEADNMAIQCTIQDLGIKHAITSAIEHHAVLHTLEALEKKGLIKLSLVNLDAEGHIDLNHLEELLKNNERSFVSLMHANNEIGTMIPLKKVGEICKKYNAIFHSDTVQTMGHYEFNLKDTYIHFITCAAHKFHGPKGVGFLYVNSNIKINPLIHGGSQERNMRGGTENVYGIVGLSKAMEIAYENLQEHQQHVREIKNYMISLLKDNFAGVKFNGDISENSLYTVLNVSFNPHPVSEMLLYKLDILGIAASGGSACTSGSNIGSHVLRALNCDMQRPSIRFSFSRYSTKDEVDYTIKQLKEIFK
jgi:cysteine desulfurase